MLTKLEAKKIAEETLGINTKQEWIVDHNLSQQVELVILDDNTFEFEFGWIFFYQSKKFIDSGDWGFTLGGNAPIIVDKYKKQGFRTGTAYPTEKYLDEFLIEHYNGVIGWKIIEPSSKSGKSKWIKTLRTQLNLNSSEALEFYNERATKVFSTPEELKLIQKELKLIGIDIEIKKQWLTKPKLH